MVFKVNIFQNIKFGKIQMFFLSLIVDCVVGRWTVYMYTCLVNTIFEQRI